MYTRRRRIFQSSDLLFIWFFGTNYSVIWFLFIRSSGFGLMYLPQKTWIIIKIHDSWASHSQDLKNRFNRGILGSFRSLGWLFNGGSDFQTPLVTKILPHL